jgi:hypothetical protein
MRETRVRKPVEYNEQALLKKSLIATPESDNDDDDNDSAERQPAKPRARSASGARGRGPKAVVPRAEPRAAQHDHELEYARPGAGHDGADAADGEEPTLGSDNPIYRASRRVSRRRAAPRGC